MRFQIYVKKIEKSALVPSFMKITLRVPQIVIFGYTYEKVDKSAPITPAMKISQRLQKQNVIFKNMYKIVENKCSNVTRDEKFTMDAIQFLGICLE